MADITLITTEYDDDSVSDFIHCEYCDKSILGDTQYRIHLTTIQHLKKRESLNINDDMPVWDNLLDYLDYLRLDEPIIGLGALEQLESQELDNGQLRVKYKCKMCNVEADLPEITSHVVGRKHRQKFLELHRPDLVTCDWFNVKKHGKLMKAKAEVVERQEGRGVPLELNPKQRKSNDPRRGHDPSNSRLQNQRQNMVPQPGGLDQDHLRYQPLGMDVPRQDFPEDPRYQEKPVDNDYYSGSAFRGGGDYPEGSAHQHGYPERDDNFRESFSEKDEYGQRYPRDNPHEEPYRENHRRPFPEDTLRQAYNKGDRYEPSYYDDDPPGQPQPVDDRQHHYEDDRHSEPRYPDRDLPHRTYELSQDHEPSYYDNPPGQPQPVDDRQRHYEDDRHSGPRYPDSDPPHRTYEPSQDQVYQEKEPIRQQTDYNHGMRHYTDRDHRQSVVSEDYRQACNEEAVYDRREQEEMGGGPYGHPYSKDVPSNSKGDTDRRFQGRDGKHYTERGFEPHHSGQDYRSDRSRTRFDTERKWGGEARYGGEMPEARMDRDQAGARGSRLQAGDIQERTGSNFHQHQGATHEDSVHIRKRRSRFTDCTEAEKELLQKFQKAQSVSEKLVQNPPPKVQRRYESTRVDREDHREHGSAQQDPANVWDALGDVQIESVEEANFLKNKLCSLLKEFQANKSGPRGASPKGPQDYEQLRREVQEQPRSKEYSYRVTEMVASERGHDIQEFGFRSRELSVAEHGYEKMHKQSPYDEYSYRMREIQRAGPGHDEIQERLQSDDYDYNYPRREIPDVGRGPDNFHHVSPERFDRRSYEQDHSWRGEIPRSAEMFDNIPRDDFNRGGYRSSPQDGSFRFREGSQRSYFDGPFEDPRYSYPHPGRMSFDEERRNPPSNLDKIASTLLQLVAHK